jgi:hypothetical protein
MAWTQRGSGLRYRRNSPRGLSRPSIARTQPTRAILICSTSSTHLHTHTNKEPRPRNLGSALRGGRDSTRPRRQWTLGHSPMYPSARPIAQGKREVAVPEGAPSWPLHRPKPGTTDSIHRGCMHIWSHTYVHPMTRVSRPPHLEFARPGANPTLESIEYIRYILRGADEPLSRNDILRILAGWSHSMGRQSLNAVIHFLAADGSVAEGSKGLIWVPQASPRLAEAIQKGRRL